MPASDVLNLSWASADGKLEQIVAKAEKGKKKTAVILANNGLTTIANLPDVLSTCVEVSAIRWIDLSFNKLTAIEDVPPDVSILYFHANHISKLKDLLPLRNLKLTNLTMHGNPVADHQHYRNFLIHLLPTLKQIDFSIISKQDKDNVDAWARTYGSGKKRKQILSA